MRGRCPRAPEVYRFRARMTAEGAARLTAFQSGPCVGARVASQRYHRSGNCNRKPDLWNRQQTYTLVLIRFVSSPCLAALLAVLERNSSFSIQAGRFVTLPRTQSGVQWELLGFLYGIAWATASMSLRNGSLIAAKEVPRADAFL